MSVAAEEQGSPFGGGNPVRHTSEQGETSTPVEESTTVLPYSLPVAGGWAYVCGTGHAHVTYEAAERCERPVAGREVTFGYVGADGGVSTITGTGPEYSPDGTYLYVHVTRDSADPSLIGTHTGYPVANIRA